MTIQNARIQGNYSQIAQNQTKCVFCDLRDKYIITELNNVVLTMNLYPYRDGHLMIVPRRHILKFSELNEEESVSIIKLVEKATDLLKTTLGIENIWLIYREGPNASKSVAHLHIQVLPVDSQNIILDNTGQKIEYQQLTKSVIDLAAEFRKNVE